MSTPPPTLQSRYELGADPVWRGRCQAAGIQAAADVMAEPASTTGHAERTAFANKVLLNPSLMSPAMAFGVAAQPGITGPDATDSDIQFTTNALWNAWSGVAS